jgi:carbonic anhydrase/acetyltransferase-like protein (isoleucine patch superfamily)
MTNLYKFGEQIPKIDPSAYVAPSACLIGSVTLGSRSSVWFHCVLRADINKIVIGNQTNIQDNCTLHVTDNYGVYVEDSVTVGHGVILHGCHVEHHCLIGMGAIVLDGARIGANSIVAAGSLVPPRLSIPENSLVMGNPAKVVRNLNPQDHQLIEQGAANYMSYSDLFKTRLSPL